ncbi:MAG: c-type cytochrome, partial [Pseudomonadota bacterium]|nr:c-type cytochrome [Pseudomonadota bacterium]
FASLLALSCPVFGGEADPDLGERIFQEECVRCHGNDATGGKDGEYPRLAGLPSGYLTLQLANFRDRKRKNKPMLPIFKTGRLRKDQIEAVAAWLSTLPVPDAADLGVPERVEGDLELGEELYVTDCALCHGLDGQGKEDTDNPPVVPQYPRYVIKQMVDFRNGRRWHEYGKQLFGEAEPDELDALVAYILHLNHNPPTP